MAAHGYGQGRHCGGARGLGAAGGVQEPAEALTWLAKLVYNSSNLVGYSR